MADQLGTLLRRLRTESGLTQEELAERAKVSVRTIRRLENNSSTDHRLTTVYLVADALGAGPEDRRALAATLAKTEPGPESQSTPAAERPAETPAETPAESSNVTSGEPPAEISAAPIPDSFPDRRRMPGVLAEAAEELAREVRRRWRLEEEQRRVHDPYALPVRWQSAPAKLTDRPENIQQLPPGVAPSRVNLDGDLRDAAKVYRRITSGRLVVLGRAGSGKSILTIRLALDLLDASAPADPVPVIFSLGSWDPTATELRDWLADRLLRDHPHLVQRVHNGPTLAAALVGADLILPVLDGFDEIAEGLRADALRALNATSLRLVLTSRRAEFAEAVHTVEAPLVSAAGIELVDLTPGDLTDYLPRTARPVTTRGGTQDPNTGVWDRVLEALHTQDTEGARNLAGVLSTPLMVILARTIYSDAAGADPEDLLNTTRFPTEHALEEHLLAGFVPTLYRRRAPVRTAHGGHPPRQPDRDPERVRRWLGYLAHHLVSVDELDQQDLAWWRIGDSLRRSTRVLAVALTCALSVTVAEWFVGLIAHQLGAAVAAGVGQVFFEGALLGPIAGLAFGTVYWLMSRFGGITFEPAHVRLRLPGTRHRTRVGSGPVRAFTSRFGAVLPGGFVMGAGCACALTLERVLYDVIPLTSAAVIDATLTNVLAFGLIFASAVGVVFGLMAVFEAPLDIASAATPVSLLSANRATVRRQVIVLVPALTLAIALGGGLVVQVIGPLVGPLNWPLPDALFIGAVGGLGGAFCYALGFTAWGQWVILTRVWLPLTGKLPWNAAEFLDDAYGRGVLRQTGAVYQFRHSRLQHHLGDAYRRHHTDYTPARFVAPTPADTTGSAD
ncbi:helix-turn-helix domain-containing protein [Streptomyces sp. NPDC059564]|uniref:helix-turn-helix domain-containing protein n=1 Tax=Streptomyces sp. NPDC059564 TaxID=3346865 RepID=UPI00368DC5C8